MPKSFQATFATKYSDMGLKECIVSHYLVDKSPALRIQDVETGEHLLTASVCASEPAQPGNIIIKDWSENSGILYALTNLNLVDPKPQKLHPLGYCTGIEVKMLGALAQAWKEHLNDINQK